MYRMFSCFHIIFVESATESRSESLWQRGCNLVRNEVTSSSSSSVLNTSSASYWLQCRWRVYIWLLIGQLGYDVIILTDPGRLQLLVTRPPRLPGLTPALDPGREPRYIATREYKQNIHGQKYQLPCYKPRHHWQTSLGNCYSSSIPVNTVSRELCGSGFGRIQFTVKRFDQD